MWSRKGGWKGEIGLNDTRRRMHGRADEIKE